jgi:hypothetical protein
VSVSNLAKMASSGASMANAVLSKVPIDKLNKLGSKLELNKVAGGLSLVGDIAGLIEGQNKNAFDYARTGINMVKTAKNMIKVTKKIPVVGTLLGVGSDILDIVEKVKNKEFGGTEIFDWAKLGTDLIIDTISEIPIVGTVAGALGVAADFLFDFLTKKTKEENEANMKRDKERWESLQREIAMAKEKDKADWETYQIKTARENEEKEMKTIWGEEGSNTEAILFKKVFNTKDEYLTALRKYAYLAQQGKLRDVNINDINIMKGRLVKDPNGNIMSFYDFLLNNPDGATEWMKNNELETWDDPNYQKFKAATAVVKTFDKAVAEEGKWIVGDGQVLNEAEVERRKNNSILAYDNSSEGIQYNNNSGTSKVLTVDEEKKLGQMIRSYNYGRK